MKSKAIFVDVPFFELMRRVLNSRRLSVKGTLLLIVYLVKIVFAMPAASLQFILYHRKIRRTEITCPPVFVLGYYRSGTTYLHNLLCGDKRFAFVTYYDMICPNSSLIFGKWLKTLLQLCINKLKIKTSFFNNKIPVLDEPAEEERLLINQGSAYTDYWRFVFPLCWHKWPSCSELCADQRYRERWKRKYMNVLRLITYKNNGKQLILKSPPNTERISLILEMFPGAKFVYIDRNPYHVFYSACNLWQRTIRKFSLQSFTGEQMEEIVFSSYIRMMEQYQKDRSLVPGGNLVEVKFEDLESKPLAVLKRIYSTLHISDFEIAVADLKQCIQNEKTYQKFQYSYDEETFKKIDRRWRKYVHQWHEKDIRYLYAHDNETHDNKIKSILCKQ